MDFGHAIVLCFFNIITSLIDCTIEDCGSQLVFVDDHDSAFAKRRKLAIEENFKGTQNEKMKGHHEHLRRINALMAIEVAEKISSNKKAKSFLHLICVSMYV